jgi:hypothetical protein
VSKRLGLSYHSGRVDHWLKIKNPAAPAVRREAEEVWGRKRDRRFPLASRRPGSKETQSPTPSSARATSSTGCSCGRMERSSWPV